MRKTSPIRQRLHRREQSLAAFRKAKAEWPHLKIGCMLSTDSKVGPPNLVRAWNLPLHTTCCRPDDPIASWTCRSVCYCYNQYADRGKALHSSQERAFEIAKLPNFAEIMIGAIRKAAVPHFRIHSFGEFFGVDYLDAWRTIVSDCDDVTFLTYTRAWRIAEYIPSLAKLAGLPNMNLLLSFDRDTGVPPEIPGTKLAWLASTDNDRSSCRAFVVFRATGERVPKRPPNRLHTPLKVLGGSFVCPHENGFPRMLRSEDCLSCRHCFFKEQGSYGQSQSVLKIPLHRRESSRGEDPPTSP